LLYKTQDILSRKEGEIIVMKQARDVHRMNNGDDPSLPDSCLDDTIQQITGVDRLVLREWEDTFRLFSSIHHRSGIRSYSAETIKRIISLRDLILLRGVPPREVAALLETVPSLESAPVPMKKLFASMQEIEEIVCQRFIAFPHAFHDTSAPWWMMECLDLMAATLGAHRLQCWVSNASTGWKIMGHDTTHTPEIQKLVEQALARGEPLIRRRRRLGTVMIAPMIVLDRMRGALVMVRAANQPMTAEERQFVSAVARRFVTAFVINDNTPYSAPRYLAWQTLIDVFPEAIVLYDRDQTPIYFNKKAMDLAVNAAEIHAANAAHQRPPRPVWETTLVNNIMLAAEETPSQRAFREKREILSVMMEIAVPSQDATRETPRTMPIMVSAIPFVERDGEVRQVLAIVQDLSKSQQIDHLKDVLAHRIQHDIKNALTSLKANAQLLADKLYQAAEGSLTFDAGKFAYYGNMAGSIEESSNAIEKIATSLEHIDGLGATELEYFSLAALVKERVGTFIKRYPEWKFDIDNRADDARLEGHWGIAHIESIVQNLLENAVRYSPPGSTITVRLFAETRSGGDRQYAHFVVEDNGYGIVAEKIDHIFELHARGDPCDAEGTPIPGTGEGLFYVRMITNIYEGQVWAKSAGSMQGSEFHVRLPLE
jgi:signal transduction histidine kinase